MLLVPGLVFVNLFSFAAFGSSLFSLHSNLHLYVTGPIFVRITYKLISWTLLIEIDNYKNKNWVGVYK